MTGPDPPRRFPYPIGTVVRAVDTFGRETVGTVVSCPNAYDVRLDDGRYWPGSLVVEVISSPDDDLDFDFLEDFDL